MSMFFASAKLGTGIIERAEKEMTWEYARAWVSYYWRNENAVSWMIYDINSNPVMYRCREKGTKYYN